MLQAGKFYRSVYSDDTVVSINSEATKAETNNLNYPNGFANYYLDEEDWTEISEEDYLDACDF